MSDILSQEELDALLDIDDDFSFNGDEDDVLEDKRHPYISCDNQRLDKSELSQESCQKIANYLALQLSKILHSKVSVGLFSLKEMIFGEFEMLLSSDIRFDLFRINSLKKDGIVKIDNSIAFSMVDILLGGEGNCVAKKREFSQIENELFKIILDTVIESLKYVYDQKIDLEPVWKAKSFLSDLNSNFMYDDIFSVATMEINFKNSTGIINICLPKLTDNSFDDSVNVYLEARLGRAEMNLNEILKLSVGDVIQLSTSTDTVVEVYADNVCRFYGKTISSGSKRSLQITEKCKKDIL